MDAELDELSKSDTFRCVDISRDRLETKLRYAPLMERYIRRKYRRWAFLLAKCVEDVIRKLMLKAAATMGWLQIIANTLAERGNRFVSWPTPSGFPFINCYRERKTERHRFLILGQTVQKTVAVGWGDAVIRGEQSVTSSVVANVVHACDAAHLMLWVNDANQAGIKDIVTVYDCIGCHAPDVERLRDIGLNALRRMYTEHDVLAELLAIARSAKKKVPKGAAKKKKVPRMPRPLDRGAYNYDDLLRATYAFS